KIAVGGAGRDAIFGDCKSAKQQTIKALDISHNPLTMINAGSALAACGEFGQTQNIVAELTKRSPKDTALNRILLPVIQARIEFLRGHAAKEIQLLDRTSTFER